MHSLVYAESSTLFLLCVCSLSNLTRQATLPGHFPRLKESKDYEDYKKIGLDLLTISRRSSTVVADMLLASRIGVRSV